MNREIGEGVRATRPGVLRQPLHRFPKFLHSLVQLRCPARCPRRRHVGGRVVPEDDPGGRQLQAAGHFGKVPGVRLADPHGAAGEVAVHLRAQSHLAQQVL